MTHWCIIEIGVVWVIGKRFNVVVRSVSCVFIIANSFVIHINIAA